MKGKIIAAASLLAVLAAFGVTDMAAAAEKDRLNEHRPTPNQRRFQPRPEMPMQNWQRFDHKRKDAPPRPQPRPERPMQNWQRFDHKRGATPPLFQRRPERPMQNWQRFGERDHRRDKRDTRYYGPKSGQPNRVFTRFDCRII